MCCLSYKANSMPADALATLGARASAGMVLTPHSRNIPSPSLEELISCSYLTVATAAAVTTVKYECDWEDLPRAVIKSNYSITKKLPNRALVTATPVVEKHAENFIWEPSTVGSSSDTV